VYFIRYQGLPHPTPYPHPHLFRRAYKYVPASRGTEQTELKEKGSKGETKERKIKKKDMGRPRVRLHVVGPPPPDVTPLQREYHIVCGYVRTGRGPFSSSHDSSPPASRPPPQPVEDKLRD
jgi:hypothetical protein